MFDELKERAWATNAPAIWPAVGCVPLHPPSDSPANLARFGGSLRRAFEAHPCGCRLAATGRTRLASYGLLDVSFEVASGDKVVPVLLYVRADRASPAHFAAARLFLEGRGEPSPVYFAPAKLAEAEPGHCFRPFHAGDLRRRAGDVPPGEYSMWWPQSDGDRFSGSRTLPFIDRAYRSLAGYETYVHAAIMRSLGYEGECVGRLKLPDEAQTFALEGPEGVLLLLCVSQEKGIRFLFPVAGTSHAYRDAFWQVFSEYAAFWNAAAAGKQFSTDPAGERTPLGWWETASAAMRLEEDRGARLSGFGSMTLGKT